LEDYALRYDDTRATVDVEVLGPFREDGDHVDGKDAEHAQPDRDRQESLEELEERDQAQQGRAIGG